MPVSPRYFRALARIGWVIVLPGLSACYQAHGVEDASTSPAGDWTYTAPVCNSFNPVVWVTLCPDGTRAWLSSTDDIGRPWQTYERRVESVDDTTVRFLQVRPEDPFEPTTLTFDSRDGSLRWDEREGDEMRCGITGSHGWPGEPEGPIFRPLPSHGCDP